MTSGRSTDERLPGRHGFFIVVLLLFVACHVFHLCAHGGGSDRDKDDRPGSGGHRH